MSKTTYSFLFSSETRKRKTKQKIKKSQSSVIHEIREATENLQYGTKYGTLPWTVYLVCVLRVQNLTHGSAPFLSLLIIVAENFDEQHRFNNRHHSSTQERKDRNVLFSTFHDRPLTVGQTVHTSFLTDSHEKSRNSGTVDFLRSCPARKQRGKRQQTTIPCLLVGCLFRITPLPTSRRSQNNDDDCKKGEGNQHIYACCNNREQ